MRISDWSSDVCSSDLDHRKSSDEEGWLHPLSLGFAGLLRGPAADSDASSEGRTRHGSNPFSTYSGPPRLGLARRCHAPTGNGSQTNGAAHAACRGGGRASDRKSGVSGKGVSVLGDLGGGRISETERNKYERSGN